MQGGWYSKVYIMFRRKQQTIEHLQLWQAEEIEADEMRLLKYPCPSIDCSGGKVLERRTIRKHLQSKRRNFAFTASILVRYFVKAYLIALHAFDQL